MPSQEYRDIIELIKARPEPTNISVQEKRARMEESLAILPFAENVATESFNIRDIPAEWVTPPEVEKGATIHYLHDGGYWIGSINTHRSMVSFLAIAAKAKVLLIDYRLAPENPLSSCGGGFCIYVSLDACSRDFFPEHNYRRGFCRWGAYSGNSCAVEG